MTRCHFLPFADDWRGKQILEKWPSCTFSTWPAQRRRQTPVILRAFIESFCLVEISVVELRRLFFPELQGFISSYFPLLHLAAAFFVFFACFCPGQLPLGGTRFGAKELPSTCVPSDSLFSKLWPFRWNPVESSSVTAALSFSIKRRAKHIPSLQLMFAEWRVKYMMTSTWHSDSGTALSSCPVTHIFRYALSYSQGLHKAVWMEKACASRKHACIASQW